MSGGQIVSLFFLVSLACALSFVIGVVMGERKR